MTVPADVRAVWGATDDVPADVRVVWGALAKVGVAIREREAEARKWRAVGLEPLAVQADLAAEAFRAKRRELAKGLVTR